MPSVKPKKKVTEIEVATPATDRSSAIYEGLRRAIIDQALGPGDKLPEDAIGESFDVSRTLVRSALTRLAAEGLVDLRRNKGAVVASPSLAEARDIFDVRRQLEDLVTQRLAGRLTPEQVAQLKAHVAREQEAKGRGGPEFGSSCRRVPRPSGQHEWKRSPHAVCRRARFAVVTNLGAVRPAPLFRVRSK